MEKPTSSVAAASDVHVDDVGGVAVECESGAVVADGGGGIEVACELLHVAEVDAGVERGGDGRVARRPCGVSGLVIPAERRPVARFMLRLRGSGGHRSG